MMQLEDINQEERKYSSIYLTEEINKFRKIEGKKKPLLHKNLLVKIELEFSEEIAELKIQPSSYLDGNKQKRKCYELNFEDSLQLLMSESKSVRKGVVNKLKELSKVIEKYNSALKTLGVPEEIIPVIAKVYEQRDGLTKTILVNAPKVEFANTIANADGCIAIDIFSKIVYDEIGLGRNKMLERLREMKILMINGVKNTPYQRYVDNGTFKVIESSYEAGGETRIGFKTLVTGKGQIYLLKKLKETPKEEFIHAKYKTLV